MKFTSDAHRTGKAASSLAKFSDCTKGLGKENLRKGERERIGKMLSSKANAALARLKEIEEKYKMKRKEQKWKEVNIPKGKGKSVTHFLALKKIMIFPEFKEKSNNFKLII